MNLYNRFQKDKPLWEVSTFGIGGLSRYFIEIFTIAEMQEVLSFCAGEALPYFILGKGSNILFHDQGFNGLVIQNKICFCDYGDHLVCVGAGYSFALLGAQTSRKGWGGLEFASGIPGSVGGAIYMNAGASGLETSHHLKEVTFVNEEGSEEKLQKEEMHFGYRTSSFQNKRGVIVAARFELNPSLQAREKQLKMIDYRMQTQPYKEKSAGCVFTNHPTISAGALIQQCGLKELSVGGAEVSALHGNFIVNKGDATAQDVLDLVQLVKSSVKEKTGIDLEMEIRTVPYDLSC